MATYTVKLAKHSTLTPSTIDTVTLTSSQGTYCEVKNRSTSGDLYFSADNTTPAVAGDDTYYVAPGDALTVFTGEGSDTIKLISAAAVAYSVTGAV
jgi:hypothetical protein